MSFKGLLNKAGITFENGRMSFTNGIGINAYDAQVIQSARFATGSVDSTSIVIDATNYQWSEAHELRYHVSDWADTYTLTEFKGIYLRVENREANASGSIFGADLYAVANAVNTQMLCGLRSYAYLKGSAGITVANAYGVHAELSWDAGGSADTISTEAACLMGKVTGGVLSDYTKVHGLILRFGDMDGGSRLFGNGILIEDDADMSGTCTLTNGISITAGCTNGISVSGTCTTALNITGGYSLFNYDISTENGRIILIDGNATNLSYGARQGALGITLDRQSTEAMTDWDGNPDCGLKIAVNNRADNTVARNGVRAFDIQARNRSTNAWVKSMELNARNDSGANTVTLEGLHIRLENYGQVDDDITGLSIEMSSENDTSSPTKTAVLIRNTDQSGMTAVRDVFRVSHTSTNGFDNLFYFGAVGDAIVENAYTIGVATSHAIVCSLAGTPIYIPVFTDLNWNT